jgi:hypothetical protein
MADVGVPERAGARRLPTEPGLLPAAFAHRDAVEALRDVEPAHRGRRDRAGFEAAVGDERPQDERHRCGAVLLADVEEELALLGGKLLGVAAVAARRGLERREPACAVGVEPALERRDRVPPRGLDAGRAEALLREHAEGGAQLAVVELLAGERADDLAAEDRDGLAVVLRRERRGLRDRRQHRRGGLVHLCSSSSPRREWRGRAKSSARRPGRRGGPLAGGTGSGRAAATMDVGLHARPEERGRLDGEPCRPRRVRSERRRGATRHLPQGRVGRQRADGREQRPGAHCARPPTQARPARRRGGAHEPERAHAAADLGRREPRDAVERRAPGRSRPPSRAGGGRGLEAPPQPPRRTTGTGTGGARCRSATAWRSAREGPTDAARASRGRGGREARPPDGSERRRPGTAPDAPRPRSAASPART